MEDVETKIYHLYKQQESTFIYPTAFYKTTLYYSVYYEKKDVNDLAEKPPMFILINSHEIKLLIDNGIQIKGILYHHYEDWDSHHNDVFEKYKNLDYDGDIYLLGTGPIINYKMDEKLKNSNIRIEWDFNSFKYLSMYSNEFYIIERSIKPLEEKQMANQLFVETLKREYKTSLFYCQYNTCIVGVEGYLNFHERFYKYLESIDNIYLINCTYGNSKFLRWLYESKYKNKIKHMIVYIGELFQTNPELIAYYRIIKNNYRNNFIELYYTPYQYLNAIDDQIIIGTDTYRNIYYYKNDPNYKKWFPEDEITHIINVSDDIINQYEIPNPSIIYEHYPISENEKDQNKCKEALWKIADRIHEIVNSDKNNKIYVHCSLGMNRSPAAVIMYYMKYRGMTLYEAYKFIIMKRRIFTSIDLFDILYKESKSTEISPLKLRTHYAFNFSQPDAYMFALYDTIYLESVLV